MKFGLVPTVDAEGGILAHSLKASGTVFRKGHVVSAEDVVLIATENSHITIARLDADDVPEDEAARALADKLKGQNTEAAPAFTGRANLIAQTAGVMRINADILALNAVDEGISLATLADYARVTERQMVATVKIIPYAVPVDTLNAAISATSGTLDIYPFKIKSASLILTETPTMKRSLTSKAEAVLRDRLTALEMDDVDVAVVPHDIEAVRDAIECAEGELILILGGSATSDRMDVCPAALVEAGGSVDRFGMPVDPGNLLFLGQTGEKQVIGLPGCVRSPALNGADWVLERIVAGLEVTSHDIAAMGEGGLLKEIPTRPQPRARK